MLQRRLYSRFFSIVQNDDFQMGRGPLCCCCFSNNVRHLALLLTSVCISVLFANLILFNFTAVLDADLPSELKPVPSLDSLHEYTIWHGKNSSSPLKSRSQICFSFQTASKDSSTTPGEISCHL